MKKLILLMYILCTSSMLSAQNCDPNSLPYEPAAGCACAFPDCDFGIDGIHAALGTLNTVMYFPECTNYILNNDDWYAFIAGSTSIEFMISVSNCLGIGDNGGYGMQAAIYSGCSDPINAVDEGTAYGSLGMQCNCSPDDIYLGSNNFVIGRTYYLVLDGCAGDICDYTINVIHGTTSIPPFPDVPPPIYGPDYVYNNETYTFSTDYIFSAAEYNWTVTGGEVINVLGNQASILVTDDSNFEVCVNGLNACYETMITCESFGIDPNVTVIEETLCLGECYDFNGQLFCDPGTYDVQVDNGNGIEEYRLILDFISYETFLFEEICIGDCFEYNNEDYCSEDLYNIVLTSMEGCDSTIFLDLTVLEDDDVIATATTEHDLDCDHISTILNGMSTYPGVNYLWSGPGIDANNEEEQNPEVNVAGTYTLTISTDAGCSSIASTEVIVMDEVPEITIEGNDPFNCNNEQNTIIASSPVSNLDYEWTGPGGFQANTNEVIVSELGIYTLTGSNANWCTNTISFEVISDQVPLIVDPGPNRHIQCEFVLTLDAPGASGANVEYLWTTQDGSILSGANTLNPTVNSAGTYTLTANTPIDGCMASADMIVHPELAIIQDDDLELTCLVTTVQLDGTDSYTGLNTSFEWSTTNGNIIDGENTLTPTVDAGGVYQLVVTRPGCTSFATTTVTDNSNPPSIDIDASSTVVTCNSNVTLTAITDATDATFTWTRNNTVFSTDASFSTNTPGPYALLIETPNGCSSSMTIELEDAIDPDFIVLFVEEEPDCSQGGAGALSAFVGGDEPFYEIFWYALDGEITGSPFGEYITISGPGTYCAEAFNPNTGCIVIDCVDVAEPSSLFVTENITQPSCPTALDGSIEISVSGGTPPYAYEWSTVPIQPSQNLYGIGPGLYTVTITDASACETLVSYIVEAGSNDIVIVDAGGDQNFDCSISSLELDGSASEYPTGSTFLWETNNGIIESGAETLTAVISSTGNYTLTIFSPNGCEEMDQVVVSDYQAEAGPGQVLDCNNLSIELDASNGPSGSEYEWSTANGNIIDGENTVAPTVDEPGVYVLIVTTENGCTYTDETTVTVDFEIPDVSVMDAVILLENCGELVNLVGQSNTMDVSYLWSGPQGTTDEASFSVGVAGVYELVVTGQNGCTNSAITEVIDNTFSPIITSNPTIQSLNCFNGNPLLLDISIESLSNDLDINWTSINGNIVEEIGNSISVDEGGSYQISVLDNTNNCSTDQPIMVEERDALIEVSSTIASCGIPDAVATVNTEFIHNPSFVWSTGATTASINGLAPGIYTVTISAPQSTCDEVRTIEVIQDPSCFVLISGFIYDDANLSCNPNGIVVPKEDVLVKITPEDLETTTDQNGYYEFLVPPGDYSIMPELVSPFVVECPSESINVSVPAGASGSADNNFFIKALSGFELYVTAGSGPANAGANQNYQITYCNNGFTTIFGTIEFTHDPLLVFDPIAAGASSYDPSTFTAVWDFEDLSFFECEFLSFQVFVPEDVPDGTVINSTVLVLPTMGDIAPANNSTTWTRLANNSGNISLVRPENEAFEIQAVDVINRGELISNIKQYPNPFFDQTNIEFFLRSEEEIEVQIFDANGRLIKVYAGFEKGFNLLIIEGSELPANGIYFYKIVGPTILKTGRMIKQ